ncbi:MAG: hypothetical protein F4201_01465 [Nitrospira sp. SB0677_bin_15]|nr:hypothetical protein [Nitrospira sp. SB0667_bin_9]MYD32216.1 hypothetical protein [Nitrospira sp. SB0661_bin_20]MYG39488.1 hypothetical protein [Nitrospira sp. SB0677_bin_15]MYH01806.1 hypothetical protein [Nitrospira sp. SB0675_bin_23]
MTTEPTKTQETHETPAAAAPRPQTPKAIPASAMSTTKLLGFAFLAGAFAALLVIAIDFVGKDPPIQFGVVNIQDILERHIKDYAVRNLTKEQQQEAAATFSKSLEFEIRQLAKKERLHLLVAPAVLSDVPDYTGYIERQLQVPDGL